MTDLNLDTVSTVTIDEALKQNLNDNYTLPVDITTTASAKLEPEAPKAKKEKKVKIKAPKLPKLIPPTRPICTTAQTVQNADTGSLQILPPNSEAPTVGIKVQINDEPAPRITTYITGSFKRGYWGFFKGQGKVPTGVVTFTIVG